MKKINNIGLLSLVFIVSVACLWDNDTLEMEERQFPGTLELITGKFLRHSDEFHEWRIKDRIQRIELHPDSIKYYDDLAVSYSKLKRDKEAIEVMEKVEKLSPNRYETYANMGTFYIHDGDLKTGIKYIDKALEINPEAHFGRERYQKYLAEYLLTKQVDGKNELPLSLNSKGNFRDFLLQKYNSTQNRDKTVLPKFEMEKAKKGVEGMMRFGNNNSPVLLEVLADIMNVSDYREATPRHLVALCFYNASKFSKSINANKRYIEKGNWVINHVKIDGENWKKNRKSIVKDLNQKGDVFFQKIRQNEIAWIADSTKNPEVEFAKLYYGKTIKVEKVVQDSLLNPDTLTKENSDPLLDAELADKNAEKNAEYFMYGFLVLGAFLVFWKFKNNK